MDETLGSIPSQSSSFSGSSETTDQNPSTSYTTPSPLPPAVARLWRLAAQRNIRNQWSKLASCRKQWASSSSCARSEATSLVNSHLSQSYMNAMDFGVLSDMPDIQKRACYKLFKRQEIHRGKLLSSYKDMVAIVTQMVNASRSMRYFLKGTSNGPLVQFSSCSEDKNDIGDGGGIPIFTFWSIPYVEKLAEELVQMFVLELNLKRLLVVELLSISSKEARVNELSWSDALYPGEFDDLNVCSLYSEEACEPVQPELKGWKSVKPSEQSNYQLNHEVLQVYLTTWLAEVNIDAHRVNDIFAVIGEEMHVSLS